MTLAMHSKMKRTTALAAVLWFVLEAGAARMTDERCMQIADGSLFVKQFGEKVRVPCTSPHYQNWRSELVLIPSPFKSMSVNTNGLRWCRSDNGIYYWQRDTNAVPLKINLGGY